MKTTGDIAHGNKALRDKRYSAALAHYSKAIQANAAFKNILQFNIDLAQRKLKAELQVHSREAKGATVQGLPKARDQGITNVAAEQNTSAARMFLIAIIRNEGTALL